MTNGYLVITQIVSDSAKKTWAQVLGDDYPEVNSPEFVEAPVKPRASLTSALKRATNEIRQGESRLNNVIIYKAVEEVDQKAQPKKDEELVEKLLQHLGVKTNPIKITRLGKFDPKELSKRPIKLTFLNSVAQEEVMSRAHKLAKAKDNLKDLGISYDMTKEEHSICKKLVTEAKER